jgi:hypothetical protein
MTNRYPYIPGGGLDHPETRYPTLNELPFEAVVINRTIAHLTAFLVTLKTPGDDDVENEIATLSELLDDLTAIGRRVMANESNAWEVYTLVDQWQSRNNVTPNAINAFVAETLQAAQDVLVQKVGEATNG